jgi:hypothetical protein
MNSNRNIAVNAEPAALLRTPLRRPMGSIIFLHLRQGNSDVLNLFRIVQMTIICLQMNEAKIFGGEEWQYGGR